MDGTDELLDATRRLIDSHGLDPGRVRLRQLVRRYLRPDRYVYWDWQSDLSVDERKLAPFVESAANSLAAERERKFETSRFVHIASAGLPTLGKGAH